MAITQIDGSSFVGVSLGDAIREPQAIGELEESPGDLFGIFPVTSLASLDRAIHPLRGFFEVAQVQGDSSEFLRDVNAGRVESPQSFFGDR